MFHDCIVDWIGGNNPDGVWELECLVLKVERDTILSFTMGATQSLCLLDHAGMLSLELELGCNQSGA